MNSHRTKTRLQIVQEVMMPKPFTINYSLLTDDELDIALELAKADKELVMIPISKAIEQGFIVPDNPEDTGTELFKFYLNQTKKNKQ